MAPKLKNKFLLVAVLATASLVAANTNLTDANGRPIVRISGIEPDAGPMTGNTRVIVRGTFLGWEE